MPDAPISPEEISAATSQLGQTLAPPASQAPSGPSPIDPSTLSAEDRAALPPPAPKPIDMKSLSAQDQQALRAATPLRMQDLSPEDMAELNRQDPKGSSIVDTFNSNPHIKNDPAMVQKFADAYDLYRNTPIADKLKPILQHPLKTIGSTLGSAAAGFGKWAWNAASGATHLGLATAEGIAGNVTGSDTLQKASELESQAAEKPLAENLAALESGATGLGETATNLAKKGALEALAPGASQAVFGPQNKLQNLYDAAAMREQNLAILKGKGAAVGEPLQLPETNPERVGNVAAGEPLTWIGMGEAFKGIDVAGKALAETFPQAGKAVQAVASKLPSAETVAGGAVQAAAKTGKGLLKTAEVTAPLAGAVIGATKSSGHVGPLAGAVFGYKAGQEIAEKAAKGGKYFEGLDNIGKQMTGAAPMTSRYAQLGQDIAGSIPSVIGSTAKGAAMDLGLAATSDTPDQAQSVGFGTGLGLLGGLSGMGRRTISGQLIAPKFYGQKGFVPSSGNFPALDAMHNAAMTGAGPGIQERLNAVRDFTQRATGAADVYLAKDGADMQKALIDSGMDPGLANQYAQQQGIFKANLNGKPVILARDVDSAPHEAFHAVQNVLGEGANQRLDAMIQQSYGDNWENIGQDYADRLGDSQGRSWRAHILDASGWGSVAAMDQLYRSHFNQYSLEHGMTPDPDVTLQYAQEDWNRAVDAAKAKNPLVPDSQINQMVWRDILSGADQTKIANSYVAREIAAEHFDSLFKNQGSALTPNDSVPGKLANVAGKLISAVGGNPLAGRESEGLQIPLRQDVAQAVRESALSAAPAAGAPEGGAPAAPPRPRVAPAGGGGGGGMPVTPQQQQDAVQEARDIANNAPTTPVAGGTQSQREVLGSIAEAMANNQGVKLNYLSAPDEPAAAATSNRKNRRDMIETFRQMPAAARALWEKTFFPNRVMSRKGGKIQVFGWSPEVFAANAHKLAGTLSDIQSKNPGAQGFSPYEIDPATKSFTPDAWRQLYTDVQTFVQNQMGGRTGSGRPLVVPAGAREAGAYAPPLSRGGGALDQRRADFINMLFNSRLPDTARITGGKMPLNILGQQVSEATVPGRVAPAVRARPSFTGEAAEKLGISGQPIQEVNPVRNEFEALAQQSGVVLPSFIEANQLLNLENIKQAEAAPEAPQFRGNTLSLAAGFLPSKDLKGIDTTQTAVRNERDGEIFVGGTHRAAYQKAYDAGYDPNDRYTEGFFTNTGKFVDREEAYRRALAAGQIKQGEARLDSDESDQLESFGLGAAQRKEKAKIYSQGVLPDEAQFAPRFKGYDSSEYWAGPRGLIKAKQGHKAAAYDYLAKNHPEISADTLQPSDIYRRMAEQGYHRVVQMPHEIDVTPNEHSPAWGDLSSNIKQQLEDLAFQHNLPVIYGNREVIPQPRPAELESAQFKPSDDPDAVKMAAIRTKDGKIFEGGIHSVAFNAAANHYGGTDSVPDYTDGFTTNSGEFLSRQEAYRRAVKQKQMTESGYERTSDLMGTGNLMVDPELESFTFREARKERGGDNALPEKAQFMHSLEGIKKMNDEEVARQARQAETETTRASSFTGNADQGVVLHSAKQRSTVFVPPGDESKRLLARLAKTEDQNARNKIIEAQFKPAGNITVVRHGETDRNVAPERIRGWDDVPLNATGRQQAEDAAEKLKNSGIQTLHASDLSRTMDTAHAIAAKTGATVVPDAGLRPWNLGKFHGKPVDEVMPKMDEYLDNPNKVVPGGESFNQFKNRFLDAYKRISDSSPNSAIVTHYRNTKLLDAWKAAGADSHTIDMDNFRSPNGGEENASSSPMPRYKSEKVGDNTRQFLDFAENSTPEDWNNYVKGYPGGLTGYAYDQGGKAESRTDVAAIKEARERAGIMMREAMKSKDMNSAISLASKAQALNEAHEGATGYSVEGNDKRDSVLQSRPDHTFPVPSYKSTLDFNFPDSEQGQTPPYEAKTDEGKAIQDSGLKLVGRKNGDYKTLYAFREGDQNPVGQVDIKDGNVLYSKEGPVQKQLETEAAQFTPKKDEREFVRSAAIRLENGEIHTGSLHTRAIIAAEDAGVSSDDIDRADTGFLTSKGRFVNRIAASRVAANAGQLGDEWIGHELDAGILPQLKNPATGKYLADEKQFMPKLSHYSRTTGLKELDPEFEGTGEPGAEAARRKNYPDIYVPRTYLGMKEYQEPRVTGLPYKYQTANIPKSRLYDFQADPKDLYPTGDEVENAGYAPMDRGAATTLYEKKIKDEGYEGYHSGGAVAKFTKTPVEQVQFKPRSADLTDNKDFSMEIARLRNQNEGQTFNPDGSVWNPKNKDFDIVSLASTNVPADELTPKRVQEALAPYGDVLGKRGAVAGVFPFVSDGKKMFSIDVNAAVPQEHRGNTLRFAKDNDQIAIWDAKAGETVDAGGKGNTRLTDPEEIAKALPELLNGRDVPITEGNQVKLRPLTPAEVKNMTREDLLERYPEAIVPTEREKELNSEISKAPILNGIDKKDDAARVKRFADALHAEATKYKDTPEFKLGAGWYDRFVKTLKDHFGDDSQIFAELLAATSPNTRVDNNFNLATEAYVAYKKGAFDRHIKGLGDGMKMLEDGSWKQWAVDNKVKLNKKGEHTEAAFMAKWIAENDLLPKKSNGKKFGMNSKAALQVLARMWLGREGAGLKTDNFVKNLAGVGHEATIDMWADRTLRRLGYGPFQKRWRILPLNIKGISDKDFKFSQAIFRDVAGRMGMKPQQLQAAMWFAEKQVWHDKGWGKLDLGDYMKEMLKYPALKAKVEQRLAQKNLSL